MLEWWETAAALSATGLAGLPVRDGPAGALVASGFRFEDSDAFAPGVAGGSCHVSGDRPMASHRPPTPGDDALLISGR